MFSAQAISNFWLSLEVMGLGLVGIFAVIGVIMLIVVLLAKFSGKGE